MTKHPNIPDYTALNLSPPVDDPTKDSLEIANLMDKNVLSICSTHVNPINVGQTTNSKSNLIRPRTRINTIKMRLGKIMNKLYNLEPNNEPEKPLNIDLGIELYQMEE